MRQLSSFAPYIYGRKPTCLKERALSSVRAKSECIPVSVPRDIKAVKRGIICSIAPNSVMLRCLEDVRACSHSSSARNVTICAPPAYIVHRALEPFATTPMAEPPSSEFTPELTVKPPLVLALHQAQLAFIPTDGFRACFVTSFWIHTADPIPTPEESEVYEEHQVEISVWRTYLCGNLG